MAQFTGKVLWFNDVDGFGFLRRSGGPDTYVHISAIALKDALPLKNDDVVEFNIIYGPEGPEASQVRKPLQGSEFFVG
jgi:CspA family cold shock protein